VTYFLLGITKNKHKTKPMIHLILNYAMVSIPFLLTSFTAFSQSNANQVALISKEFNTTNESAVPGNNDFSYRNDINIKAVRNFLTNFKNAVNVTWD
jgi:hypothetical protein